MASELKQDHINRPLSLYSDGRLILETCSPFYKQASDFLIEIAEPVCRLDSKHEYKLTPCSLYAAVSAGIDTQTIITVLDKLSKTTMLPKEIIDFIHAATRNYGKVKLVLKKNRYFTLLQDDVISQARKQDFSSDEEEKSCSSTNYDYELLVKGIIKSEKEKYAFELKPDQVGIVKERCLPNALNYPMLEEYDFRNDTVNPNLNMEMKPQAQLRPYQSKSLSKMFGNGRARSGIIVLPCGAGKSLVGVSAACQIRKSCLCLATSNVSVDQWAYQFRLWSTIREDQICCFTSDASSKKRFKIANAAIVVTTYHMIAYGGERSLESQKIMKVIRERQWGLLLMDEVHVVPAVEDERISDLNFLIGPKLYEANWLDLAKQGYTANVICAEVWCPMTNEFFAEYSKEENSKKKQALCAMNPNKFRACEFLIRFHEQRQDKIIVFSDNLLALREYALKLGKLMIYGATSHEERTHVLSLFKNNPSVNTIFISKVGDNSIDIPEANVVIQISSHAGSRGKHEDRVVGGKEEYNAFFYSLETFLMGQSYSFKTITNLPPPDSGASLSYHYVDEQLQLLNKVLNAGDDKDDDDITLPETGHARIKKPKDPAKRHDLFKKRRRLRA
ncbi:hypothetical protein MKW98_029905 [Papaver atlanticum]|uniref:DNA 3'-5' helicase n=1 Tax=Papaver atlanticum TaxID=357466 RepID=A0AAD4XZ00_9MAGN|nr:hypothetical protein MKW98_029905 [Papaver atlanticum]